MAGISPTGCQMLWRKEWEHNRCPRCDQDDKDTWHVLQCRALSAKKCWSEQIAQLKVDLEKVRTDPMIILAVTRHLLGWYRNQDVSLRFPPLVQAAVDDQAWIGWHLLLCGRASIHWQLAQDCWLSCQHTKWKSTGATWMMKVCRLLITFHHSVWEH